MRIGSLVLVAALLAACIVDATGAETSPDVQRAADPCNRRGSGWEDVPGCICPLECPPAPSGYTRTCSQTFRSGEPGTCGIERRP